MRASSLPAFSRLIMMVLSDIADTGTAELPPGKNPSTAQLSRETGIRSLTSVREHRQALEKAGWIVFTPPTLEERVNHKPGSYKLRVPPGEGRLPAVGAPKRGSFPDRREGQEMTLGPESEGQEMTHATVSSWPSRGSAADPLSTNNQNDQKNRAAALRESADRVCGHMADRIEANGTPRPPITDAWRSAAAALMYEDQIEEERVHRAIDFAHDDDFWRINITTPAKLRAKWHELRLSAERARRREQTHPARAAPLPPPVAPVGPPRPAPGDIVAAARTQIAQTRSAIHSADARHRPQPSPDPGGTNP